jgi:predicted nuclease with TOPRIM domain
MSLSSLRLPLMAESEEQRERLAKELAYQQGRRDSDVDARLRSHENRLNAINGSIDRHANEAKALRNSIDDLGDKIDAVNQSLATKAALEAERVKQIAQANDKQISTKAFWLGVAAIMAAILGPYLASHGGF